MSDGDRMMKEKLEASEYARVTPPLSLGDIKKMNDDVLKTTLGEMHRRVVAMRFDGGRRSLSVQEGHRLDLLVDQHALLADEVSNRESEDDRKRSIANFALDKRAFVFTVMGAVFAFGAWALPNFWTGLWAWISK